MRNIIVVDTSCLILLNKIKQLALLKKLFNHISITKTVANEFGKKLPDWVNIVPDPKAKTLSRFLDLGEATSIVLASKHKDSLLIIDETKGRKIAKEMEVKITGTLGVLVTAKQKGHISSVKPVLQEIHHTNFRLSPALIQTVLEKVGEI